MKTSLFEEDLPCLRVGVGCRRHHLAHEHYRQNFIGLKFNWSWQKYSARKSQHCQITKKIEVWIPCHFYCWVEGWLYNKDTIFRGLGRRGGGGGVRDEGNDHVLCFGGPCSSIVVLTSSLIKKKKKNFRVNFLKSFSTLKTKIMKIKRQESSNVTNSLFEQRLFRLHWNINV